MRHHCISGVLPIHCKPVEKSRAIQIWRAAESDHPLLSRTTVPLHMSRASDLATGIMVLVPVLLSSVSAFAFRGMIERIVGVSAGYLLAALFVILGNRIHSDLMSRDQRKPVFERLRELGYSLPVDCPFVGVGFSKDVVYVHGDSSWDLGALVFSGDTAAFYGTKCTFSLRPQDIVRAEVAPYPSDSGRWEMLFVNWQDENGRTSTLSIEPQESLGSTQARAQMEKWKYFLDRCRTAPANSADPAHPPHEEDLPLVLAPKMVVPPILNILKFFSLAVLASTLVNGMFIWTRSVSLIVVILGFVGFYYFGFGVSLWKSLDQNFEARGQKVRKP